VIQRGRTSYVAVALTTATYDLAAQSVTRKDFVRVACEESPA
jgi:hypothetical protein